MNRKLSLILSIGLVCLFAHTASAESTCEFTSTSINVKTGKTTVKHHGKTIDAAGVVADILFAQCSGTCEYASETCTKTSKIMNDEYGNPFTRFSCDCLGPCVTGSSKTSER